MFIKDYKRKERKKIRVRKKISGTAERPRLSVFRSLNHVYVQLVDDSTSTTLISASSKSKELADEIKNAKSRIEQSKLVGSLLAKKAVEKGITKAVFDRSGYKYHGRVKAVAEGAREGGIQI